MDNSESSFLEKDLNSVKPEIDLKKNTIILDIDECLIYFTYYYRYMTSGPHDMFVLKNMDGSVFKRPYLEKFLEVVFDKYNVGFWTTSTKDYAMEILKEILLKEQMDVVKFVLARENTNSKLEKKKGIKVPVNKYDKSYDGTNWRHNEKPRLLVGYIDVFKNKKFTTPQNSYVYNKLLKDLSYVFKHPEYGKFCNKDNTILIDDNPNHYQINNGCNIIAIQPWYFKVWCDDKLQILMDWLIKHHDKKIGKCKLPNLLDKKIPKQYDIGKGWRKLNNQLIEKHCQDKVKPTKTSKLRKSIKSVKKSKSSKKTNISKKSVSNKKIFKKTKKIKSI